jgi:DNA (cytosine-5)-methyltransferase 1
MKKLTYIDLFSGAGGLSVGFGRENFHLLMANDIDNQALDTIRYNLSYIHPETNTSQIIHGDITELYKHLGGKKVKEKFLGHKTVITDKSLQIKKRAPNSSHPELETFLNSLSSCDVVAGGPPCQGFSMIGRSKRGNLEERTQGFIDDPRNTLFSYYLKFVEKLNPKLVLIENVKGLSSASGYQDLIKKSLENIGKKYLVESIVFNAKDFGVPQNRERIFFIGIRSDFAKAKNTSPNQLINNIRKSIKNHKKVFLKDAILDLPSIFANPKPNNYDDSKEVSFLSKSCFGMNVSDLQYDKLIDKSKCKYYRNLINTIGNKQISVKYLSNHKARYNNIRDLFIYENLTPGKYLTDPLNKQALSKVTYGKKGKNGEIEITSFADKYFKLDSESFSKTIIAHLETDGNSYVHPTQTRSITPREAARIQSFPDWYFFTGSLRNQFKQIGNAVPPLLAGAIAKEFKSILMKI